MIMRFGVLVLMFALGGSVTRPAHAQATSAALDGQVQDGSGGVIVGATLEIVNDATEARVTRQTDNQGIYSFPNLPAGSYHLIVSKEGFRTLAYQKIILNLQDVKAITITLPIGSVNDTVTVDGGAPLIDTESAAVSTVVDEAMVKNMPLNGRSFQDLILLTPGVITNSPQTALSSLGVTGEFSVNGQRTEGNYYTVDGVSANVGVTVGTNMYYAGTSGSVPAATALGTTQALVSVDDLQEFRVQSSTYSAEYGRNPGGQFAFETKSGTNQWHGTAYDYLRNDYFDANDWFLDYLKPSEPTLTKPALRQNDFGGTVGGPVRIPGLYNGKDKTFFFVSYEGLRLLQPQAATQSVVPDSCLRGVTASCPASGSVTPAASAVQPVLNAFPVQNGPESFVPCNPQGDPTCTQTTGPTTGHKRDGLAQFIGTWSNPSSIDSTSIRFDHVVRDKMRFFFRFAETLSGSTGKGGLYAPSVATASDFAARVYTAGVTSVLTRDLNNEFRLNYSSNATTSTSTINAFGNNVPVNLAQLAGLSANATTSFALDFGGGSELFQAQSSGTQSQWNLVDTLAYSLGRHQLKFGFDYRRLAPFAAPLNPVVAYIYFDEGAVKANSGAFTLAQANTSAYPLYVNLSAFAQDEWKVSSRLTLSPGLRWEINPAPGVTRGLMPYTLQGTGPDDWTLAPQGTPMWKTTWYNFAPRLGAAYLLRRTPGWETVVRGGGGLFFDTGQLLGSLGFLNPGFSTQTISFGSFSSNSAMLVQEPINPPTQQNGGLSPFSFLYGFAPHLQLPYTVQWNGSIQQALGKVQALTVSYIGSHASRLMLNNFYTSSTNPNGSTFNFVENGLTSDYGSLQAQVRRSLDHGLSALGSYTLSHCLDYGSLNYDLGSIHQRGNCDFDVRHNFSAAFSYDLPNWGTNAFANAIVHHWGVDDRFTARTGFPVPLNGNQYALPNGQLSYLGLNFVPNQPIYLYGANCAAILQGLGDLLPSQGCPGGRAINPLAFADVNSGSGIGNVPRNFARGFGAWQMDISIRREFALYENLNLQFRAEAFNVLNHPNFGAIDSAFGSPGFGLANGTLSNSLGILSPLYQMGGPRSVEFALKLVF